MEIATVGICTWHTMVWHICYVEIHNTNGTNSTHLEYMNCWPAAHAPSDYTQPSEDLIPTTLICICYLIGSENTANTREDARFKYLWS
jgi:hypothetical protein